MARIVLHPYNRFRWSWDPRNPGDRPEWLRVTSKSISLLISTSVSEILGAVASPAARVTAQEALSCPQTF